MSSERLVGIIAGFVRRGGSLNSKTSEGHTLLHLCVDEELESVMQYLLQNGADPNIVDGSGWPILAYAVMHEIEAYGQDKVDLTFSMTRRLILSGADKGSPSPEGRTPIEIARVYGPRIEKQLASVLD